MRCSRIRILLQYNPNHTRVGATPDLGLTLQGPAAKKKDRNKTRFRLRSRRETNLFEMQARRAERPSPSVLLRRQRPGRRAGCAEAGRSLPPQDPPHPRVAGSLE